MLAVITKNRSMIARGVSAVLADGGMSDDFKQMSIDSVTDAEEEIMPTALPLHTGKSPAPGGVSGPIVVELSQQKARSPKACE